MSNLPEHGVYDQRNFEALPILADALEEVGFDHQELLDHLRQNLATAVGIDQASGATILNEPTGLMVHTPHVRGCWALDLILGKE